MSERRGNPATPGNEERVREELLKAIAPTHAEADCGGEVEFETLDRFAAETVAGRRVSCAWLLRAEQDQSRISRYVVIPTRIPPMVHRTIERYSAVDLSPVR